MCVPQRRGLRLRSGLMDPRDLVVAQLTAPFDDSARRTALAAASSTQGKPVAFISSGHEQRGTRPEGIEFLKSKEVNGHVVLAARWRAGDGQPWHGAFSFVRDPDGHWQSNGGHSGGGDGPGAGPRRGRPWVNLGGGGRLMYLAGLVEEAPEAATVRLLGAGRTFEDIVDESRWALFPTDLPNEIHSAKYVVEILAADGSVLARHKVFGRADPA